MFAHAELCRPETVVLFDQEPRAPAIKRVSGDRNDQRDHLDLHFFLPGGYRVNGTDQMETGF